MHIQLAPVTSHFTSFLHFHYRADRKWQCGCLHHRSRQEMAMWLLKLLQPTGSKGLTLVPEGGIILKTHFCFLGCIFQRFCTLPNMVTLGGPVLKHESVGDVSVKNCNTCGSLKLLWIRPGEKHVQSLSRRPELGAVLWCEGFLCTCNLPQSCDLLSAFLELLPFAS